MHQLVMPSFNCCSAVWGKMQKGAASLISEEDHVKAIQVRV